MASATPDRVRLALVLAAPFPLHQGSQVFVADQARALREAGAETTLFCYGAGVGEPDASLPVFRTAPQLTPTTLRSNANPKKAVADLALATKLMRVHRREPFDAVLAHNSEAAAATLLVRRWLGIPILYVVHTLLRHELSAYGPPMLARGVDAMGGRLERALARHADGVLALCEPARAEFAPHARGPVARIPPGSWPQPAVPGEEVTAACRAHGLTPGTFVLYTGNLDRYQDLERLDAAAARPELAATPVVVATHDAAGAHFAALRVVTLADVGPMRALLHGCALAVLPRCRPGGFPIKLLNYLEAAQPVLAHEGVAEGLTHGETGWLLSDGASPSAWAGAIRSLLEAPARRRELGLAGHALLRSRHAWPELAKQTLALIEQSSRSPRGPPRT